MKEGEDAVQDAGREIDQADQILELVWPPTLVAANGADRRPQMLFKDLVWRLTKCWVTFWSRGRRPRC